VGNPVRMSLINKAAAVAYMRLPNALAATLIPVSHHVARTCSHMPAFRQYPMCVVHNAIAINQFRFRPVEIPSSEVRVGMVARLDEIKDHFTLLRAWKFLCQQNCDWTLEFAGDGVLRPKLEKIAVALGIEKQVVFHGWVKDVPSLMMNWAMVAHSTTEEEGLGNSMLEAMALGRPLVATDVGPVREVTDDGRVARLSRAGDAVDLATQIFNTVRERQETYHLVEAARAWVERSFSQQAMVHGYLHALGLNIPS
jgi:glycosyltransferase involved in cell wall biosynthesis